VYNTVLCIERAVESVLAQTFRDFELILVDDGSTDGSGEICDELSKKDSRIKVIHQANQGASVSRATAFKIAEGEYIGFVDSDDFALPYMYGRLISAARESEADIVRSGFITIPENSVPSPLPLTEQGYIDSWKEDWEKTYPIDAVFDTQSFLRYFFEEFKVYAIWQTIFRKGIIQPCFFEEGLRRAVDYSFWLHLFDDKPSLTVRTIPDCLYVYLRRQGSITDDPSLWESRVKVRIQALRFYAAYGLIHHYETAYHTLVRWCIWGMIDLSGKSPLEKNSKKKLLRLLRRTPRMYLRNDKASLLSKSAFIAFYISPGMYLLIHRFYRKLRER